MTFDKDIFFRFVRVLILNLIFLVFLDKLNDIFAGLSYIFAPAILIVAPALFLPTFSAFLSAVIMGYFYSVSIDSPVGFLPVLFALSSLFVSMHRTKFRNYEFLSIISLSWCVNMAILCASILLAFGRAVEPYSAYILKVFVDTVFSSLFILLFSAFAVSLQRSFAYLFGDDLSLAEDENA